MDNHCGRLCFSCLSAVCASNRVTDSVLMGSEMSNKAPRSGETARADTKLTDKGQTDRFHTLTEGRTSRKAAGSRDPQMDTREELLYIRAGGKFEFSTEKYGIWKCNFPPKRIEIYTIVWVSRVHSPIQELTACCFCFLLKLLLEPKLPKETDTESKELRTKAGSHIAPHWVDV